MFSIIPCDCRWYYSPICFSNINIIKYVWKQISNNYQVPNYELILVVITISYRFTWARRQCWCGIFIVFFISNATPILCNDNIIKFKFVVSITWWCIQWINHWNHVVIILQVIPILKAIVLDILIENKQSRFIRLGKKFQIN